MPAVKKKPPAKTLKDVLESTLGVTLEDAREAFGKLTEREQDVAFHMAGGFKNKDSSASLGISRKTHDIHRMKIHLKFDTKSVVRVANTVNILLIARDMGLEAE